MSMQDNIVIVTGSRKYTNYKMVHLALVKAHPSLIVTGGAKGADEIAHRWAVRNFIPYCVVPANWELRGKSAGPIRNVQMLKLFPTATVLAFPLGKSPGTWNCISEARKRGHKVDVLEQ